MNLKYKILIVMIATIFNIAKTMSQQPLRIVSWNIKMLPVLSMFDNSDKRAKIIANKLTKLDYDIIVFQEAFTSSSRNQIYKITKNTYHYQYGPFNKGNEINKTNSGLWILSKIPLNIVNIIKFNQSAGFDRISRKGAVMLEGEFKGKKFQLINTHLQSGDYNIIKHKQLQEIKKDLIDKYNIKNIPQIICGDFNIPKSDNFQYNNMIDTMQVSDGEITGDVNVSYDGENNNMIKNKDVKLIDYILIKNINEPYLIKRKINVMLGKLKNNLTNLSDHYAIEATIFLK